MLSRIPPGSTRGGPGGVLGCNVYVPHTLLHTAGHTAALASAQGQAAGAPTGGSHMASVSREREVEGGTKPASHCAHRCTPYQRPCPEIKGPEHLPWVEDGGGCKGGGSCEGQAGAASGSVVPRTAQPGALACTATGVSSTSVPALGC